MPRGGAPRTLHYAQFFFSSNQPWYTQLPFSWLPLAAEERPGEVSFLAPPKRFDHILLPLSVYDGKREGTAKINHNVKSLCHTVASLSIGW
jgi:hypothetical protein